MASNPVCVGQSPEVDSTFSAQYLEGTTDKPCGFNRPSYNTGNDGEQLQDVIRRSDDRKHQLQTVYAINSDWAALLIWRDPNPPNPV